MKRRIQTWRETCFSCSFHVSILGLRLGFCYTYMSLWPFIVPFLISIFYVNKQIESRRRFRIIRSWDQDGWVDLYTFVDCCLSYHLQFFVFKLDFMPWWFNSYAVIVLRRLIGWTIFHLKEQEKEQRWAHCKFGFLVSVCVWERKRFHHHPPPPNTLHQKKKKGTGKKKRKK